MKFVCLGFIDESEYASLPTAEGQRMMEQCFAYDDELRRGGHFLGGEALQSASTAVTLRMNNGSIDVIDGPYAETKEMLGGILLLEARDLNHAIALMSRHPGVKVGPFEIRPADPHINELIAARSAASKSDTGSNGPETHAKQTLRAALKFSYDWIKPLADDLIDSPMTSPTVPPGNHPMWVMGHLVFSSSGLLGMITGRTSPYAAWDRLFAGGTKPIAQAATYPSYPEVITAYDAVHAATVDHLDGLPDARLDDRPPAVWDQVRDDPQFQTIGQLFLFIAMHEMSHRGQLADARTVLRRPPFA